MALYQISEPVAEPMTLDEAKNQLRVDRDISDDNLLIESLISAARMDAEAKTGGRVFAFRKFEWIPDGVLAAGVTVDVPVSPALSVVVKDSTGAEIPSSGYVFVKSSLAPYGCPMYAKLTPLSDWEGVTVEVEAGWPNEEVVEEVRLETHPSFRPACTTYDEGTVTIQFDRPVSGDMNVRSFSLFVNGQFNELSDVAFDPTGRIVLSVSDPLSEGDEVTLSYTSGYLKDRYGNYVMPIVRDRLPDVEFDIPQTPFQPAETRTRYRSTVPSNVKAWMTVRVATLYQQRTEVAIQAGKTSNAFFPRAFINGMLDPYMVERV